MTNQDKDCKPGELPAPKKKANKVASGEGISNYAKDSLLFTHLLDTIQKILTCFTPKA